MEIILSPRCKSFTGTISRYHGYAVRQSGKRFFSYRTPGKHAKPDGHWQFIVSCAEMAQLNLHIADIRVSRNELIEAVEEAGWCLSRFMENLRPTLNAKDILTFKQTAGL